MSLVQDYPVIVPYQIDKSVQTTGRHVAATKRYSRCSFGFAHVSSLVQGNAGVVCRGFEIEVKSVWSLTSGKLQIYLNHLLMHSSVSANRASSRFYHSITIPDKVFPGGHIISISDHASTITRAHGINFCVSLNGQDFESFFKIYELGGEKMWDQYGDALRNSSTRNNLHLTGVAEESSNGIKVEIKSDEQLGTVLEGRKQYMRNLDVSTPRPRQEVVETMMPTPQSSMAQMAAFCSPATPLEVPIFDKPATTVPTTHNLYENIRQPLFHQQPHPSASSGVNTHKYVREEDDSSFGLSYDDSTVDYGREYAQYPHSSDHMRAATDDLLDPVAEDETRSQQYQYENYYQHSHQYQQQNTALSSRGSSRISSVTLDAAIRNPPLANRDLRKNEGFRLQHQPSSDDITRDFDSASFAMPPFRRQSSTAAAPPPTWETLQNDFEPLTISHH